MPKKYLVMERVYEYNDETYDERDGGTPKTLYDDKADAEKEATRLNKLTWKTHGYLYEYHEDYYDSLREEDLNIEEAVKKQGPLDVFYVSSVEAK
jgi:hypothetical protein